MTPGHHPELAYRCGYARIAFESIIALDTDLNSNPAAGLQAIMKKKFNCPQCGQTTITTRQKYLAGMWRIIYCDECQARLCAQPILMALAYALYFWILAWFGFSVYFEGNIESLVYLIPAWLFLDFLNINLMPLAVMKSSAKET